MTSREKVKAALTFQELAEIPTELDDVIGPVYRYGSGHRSGDFNKKGVRYDEWGTQWVAAEDGVYGEVKTPLITDLSMCSQYTPPYEVLEQADLSAVNQSCEHTDKFVMAQWWANYNIFERLQHLRGTEQLLCDLCYLDKNFNVLKNKVHSYFMKQGEMWAKTKVDGMHIADDWGMQVTLLTSPDIFREIFKPLYKEYCDLAHSYGKYVVMHSDGNIEMILDDLIDIGVDAVNAQLFCMDIKQIAKKYHHKIAFWGEIDRQHIMPFGTESECRWAVRMIADTFFQYGKTGIIGHCFGGKDIPQANVNAVYDEWKKV